MVTSRTGEQQPAQGFFAFGRIDLLGEERPKRDRRQFLPAAKGRPGRDLQSAQPLVHGPGAAQGLHRAALDFAQLLLGGNFELQTTQFRRARQRRK